MPQFLKTAAGRRIAYHQTAGEEPGVVFLGGFMSDMTGTKATYLEDWARREGRAFLRFDYSGHGASSGEFSDGCISDWAEDAIEAIGTLTNGPQILVGSSMGGWVSLLVTKALKERVAGFVGVAAAPDFIRDMHAAMSDAEKARLQTEGVGKTPDTNPSGYLDVWSKLIFDDAAIVLDDPLILPFPVRLLHGTEDEEVPQRVPLRLLDHAEGEDIRLTLVKGANHRFSTPDCLALIVDAIGEVTDRCQA